MVYRKLYFCIALLLSLLSPAQDGKKYLQEVIEIEKKNSVRGDDKMWNRNMLLKYSVRVTNWDNESVISNITVHKQAFKMHFFSEQVTMYLDEYEHVMILPAQKLLILNSSNEQVAGNRMTEDQYMYREQFLRSCIVVSCITNGDGDKILTLKINEETTNPTILIRQMVYVYDQKKGKIKSVRSSYDEDYDLKEMLVTYLELKEMKSYEYGSVKGHVMNRKGNIHSKFSGYEIIDNRDNPLTIHKKR